MENFEEFTCDKDDPNSPCYGACTSTLQMDNMFQSPSTKADSPFSDW